VGITTTCVTLMVGALVGAAPDDLMTASARINTKDLEEGESYEIAIELRFKEGYSASKAGIPAPLLQIEVPESVKLLGKELESYGELKRNEFLQEPYERLLSEVPARVGFEVRRAPKTDDVIGLNILAYVGSESDEDAYFVRRRLALKVAGGAEAESVLADNSSWGREDLLQIGQKADLFTLPKAGGESVALADLVLCHSLMFGYTDFSLHRASSIFICQSTPRCAALTSVDQAAVSSRSVLMSPIRRPATH